MYFFGPQKDVGVLRQYFHPDRLNKLTYITYYHPLANLNLGYFLPYYDQKVQNSAFWVIFDQKINPRFSKIFLSEQQQKTNIIHFYVFLMVPGVFNSENSLKMAIFDLKWAIFDQKLNPRFSKIFVSKR